MKDATSIVSSAAWRGLQALIIPIGDMDIAVEELCMLPQPAYAGSDNPCSSLETALRTGMNHRCRMFP